MGYVESAYCVIDEEVKPKNTTMDTFSGELSMCAGRLLGDAQFYVPSV